MSLLLKGLLQRGYDASVVCLSGEDSRLVSHFVPLERALPIINKADPIAPWAVFENRLAYARLHEPDVVISYLTEEYSMAAPAYAFARIPVIINNERWMSARHGAAGGLSWWRAANRAACLVADTTVVNSDAGMRDLAEYTGLETSRFSVISNGFDPTLVSALLAGDRADIRRELGATEDSIVVGTSCRLAVEKDVPTFLRALKRLFDASPRMRGVVVGDGPLRLELESVAREMGIASRVRWLGAVPVPWRFYAAFDVFALSSRFEGQPNILLEMLELGVPCVSTDAGGSRDVLDDGRCGIVVPVGDDSAMADALLRITADARSTGEMVGRGRRRVRTHFAVDRMVDQYDRLIGALLDRVRP